jgi:SAM-dependent methyltransferase
LAVFACAFLLFQVQPLLGRFVLPWFGGSAAVWTTCLLFFQILLLGGYAYAHALSAWAAPRRQAQVHGTLLAAAALTLPIIPSSAWQPRPEDVPAARVLLLLLATAGLPGFVLTASGPLLQKWHAGLSPGRAPYRLYSLSNAGSLLALLSYPVLFEPSWTRAQQAWTWSGAFVLFAALCGWCAWGFARGGGLGAASGDAVALDAEGRRPPATHVFLWVALTACASALLMSVTNAVCYDLAAIPLFWVVPLSIYLLTFVLCFDSPRRYLRTVYLALLVASTWGVCQFVGTGDAPLMRQLPVYLGVLFVGCMVCHGETYRLRPHPRYLTGFYLAIALGGALGGVFVAVVAPLAFTGYFELFWAMGATAVAAWLALRPDARRPGHERWRTWLWAAGAPTVAALCLMVWETAGAVAGEAGRVAAVRSFYGALSVHDVDRGQGLYRELRHGSIVHGMQVLEPGRSRVTTAYYGPGSGVGWVLQALPGGEGGRRVGLVGLGAGTLAAYGRPGDLFRFYELSPEVARMAREHFTFLEESEAEVERVLGDARLALEREEPQAYDLIVLDAFNGDAIPVHLLTREAFDEYRRHLRPGGVIAVHVSNRYVDLRPVVKGGADYLGLATTVVSDRNEAGDWWIEPSTWVLVGGVTSEGAAAGNERPGAGEPLSRLWTDEHSSVFGILKW